MKPLLSKLAALIETGVWHEHRYEERGYQVCTITWPDGSRDSVRRRIHVCLICQQVIRGPEEVLEESTPDAPQP